MISNRGSACYLSRRFSGRIRTTVLERLRRVGMQETCNGEIAMDSTVGFTPKWRRCAWGRVHQSTSCCSSGTFKKPTRSLRSEGVRGAGFPSDSRASFMLKAMCVKRSRSRTQDALPRSTITRPRIPERRPQTLISRTWSIKDESASNIVGDSMPNSSFTLQVVVGESLWSAAAPRSCTSRRKRAGRE